jgi:hypothetical protein
MVHPNYLSKLPVKGSFCVADKNLKLEFALDSYLCLRGNN